VTVTTAFLWDIDGTLLSTARAGVGALEDACREVLGRSIDLQDMHTAGLPDPEIARRIIARSGPCSDEVLRAFLDCYVARLPLRLLDRRGGVMPRVVDALSAIDAHPAAVNALLTGNMRGGADAKLGSYALARFFEQPLVGGFGEDGLAREDIAAAAIERVRVRFGQQITSFVVIGDTPADVRCGVAHGLRTIAVATGAYSEAELLAAGPWWVVPELPPATELLDKVGL
jgi:phosphoglycolate phosphatase-like HAD superfamily hydrolase